MIAALAMELVRRSRRHAQELEAWSAALEDQQRRLWALQSMAATLASALTVSEVAAATLDHGLPLVGAAAGSVEVLDERGTLVEAARSGDRAVLTRGGRQRLRDLAVGDTTFGRLTVWSASTVRIDERSDALLGAVTALASEAIARARRYDAEHGMVRALQTMLLPVVPDRVGDVTLAVKYQPVQTATGVGGDWYDVLDTERGVACLIGDVVGKGVLAAGTMGQLRIATRTVTDRSDPAAVLRSLDDFAAEFRDGLMTTVAYVVVDVMAGRLSSASAGHPPPVLLRDDGSGDWLDGASGPPLGVVGGGHPRCSASTQWNGTARLLLYTDGLIERPGEPIDVGLQRLLRAAVRLGDLPPQAFLDCLLVELVPPEVQRDDIAVLCADLPAPIRGSAAA